MNILHYMKVLHYMNKQKFKYIGFASHHANLYPSAMKIKSKTEA